MIAGDRPPRYGENRDSSPVVQDRLILTRSGAGAPELQRCARCLPVFAHRPRSDKYRNGVMKHPQLSAPFRFSSVASRHRDQEVSPTDMRVGGTSLSRYGCAGRRDILVPIWHCIETGRSLLPGGCIETRMSLLLGNYRNSVLFQQSRRYPIAGFQRAGECPIVNVSTTT